MTFMKRSSLPKKLVLILYVFVKYKLKELYYFLRSKTAGDMRYSIALCQEESDFRQKRKPLIFQAMKKLLGSKGPKTIDEVSHDSFFRTDFLVMAAFL